MSHQECPVVAYPTAPAGQVYPPQTLYPQPGQAYPPPPTWEGQAQVPYVAAPPPMGYPMSMRDEGHHPQTQHPVETKSRGDGFWKGCAAALCCCCVLDCCF